MNSEYICHPMVFRKWALLVTVWRTVFLTLQLRRAFGSITSNHFRATTTSRIPLGHISIEYPLYEYVRVHVHCPCTKIHKTMAMTGY